MKTTIFLFLFGLLTLSLNAQNYKFGKVSKTELKEKVCSIDSTANACILYSERKTFFDYIEGKGFVIREEYHMRIKIYNKEGFDIATKKIPVFHTNSEKEEVKSLKAVTYNLENGKIVKTKLNKKNIYTEKTTKYYNQVKFTMPNLKPGSVIEWKYTFYSPFMSKLNDVVLQYEVPMKKSHTHISIPEFFKYRTYQKGFFQIPVKTKSISRNLSITEKNRTGGVGWSTVKTNYTHHSVDFEEIVQEINMTNVPGLKEEPYAGNMNNYRAAIVYELVSIKFPNDVREDYALTWEDVVNKTFFSSKFGGQLKKQKYLKKDLEHIVALPNNDEKLKTVFELAKQKIKWNKEYDYFVDKGVVKAYKEGTGNVADVNLNLINMLNIAGFEAYPVLISTVNHGIPLFATRTGFNYVIAAVKLGDEIHLLDATDPYTTPDLLPKRVLNFQGRLIYKDGKSQLIPLFPNYYSKNQTHLNFTIKDEQLSGTALTSLDNYYAYQYRKSLDGKQKDTYQKWLQEQNENIEIINSRIKNAGNPYKKITEAIKFETDEFMESISGKLFIDPFLEWKTFNENPFKSKERKFPIFFNYPRLRTFNLIFTIPQGYEVLSLPKSDFFTFGDKTGGYEYKVEQKGNRILINSNYVINHPIVSFKYYQELKNFIDKIINKEKEKIVLKKK